MYIAEVGHSVGPTGQGHDPVDPESVTIVAISLDPSVDIGIVDGVFSHSSDDECGTRSIVLQLHASRVLLRFAGLFCSGGRRSRRPAEGLSHRERGSCPISQEPGANFRSNLDRCTPIELVFVPGSQRVGFSERIRPANRQVLRAAAAYLSSCDAYYPVAGSPR